MVWIKKYIDKKVEECFKEKFHKKFVEINKDKETLHFHMEILNEIVSALEVWDLDSAVTQASYRNDKVLYDRLKIMKRNMERYIFHTIDLGIKNIKDDLNNVVTKDYIFSDRFVKELIQKINEFQLIVKNNELKGK